MARLAQIMDPVQQEAMKEAYAWAIHNTRIMYTGVAAIGVLVSLFVATSNSASEHVETVIGIRVERRTGDEDVEITVLQLPSV